MARGKYDVSLFDLQVAGLQVAQFPRTLDCRVLMTVDREGKLTGAAQVAEAIFK